MGPLYKSSHGSGQRKKYFSSERPRLPRTSAPPDLSTVLEDSKENAQSSVLGGDPRDILGIVLRSGEDPLRVSFKRLLCFSDSLDILLMLIGTINGFLHGILITCVLLTMGSIFRPLADKKDDQATADSLTKEASQFLYISAALFTTVLFEQSCWMYTGERQATRLRKYTFETILQQEPGFFDLGENSMKLVTIYSDDIGVVQDAIEKIGHCVCFMTSFAGSMIVATYFCWQLGGVALATLAFTSLTGRFFNSFLRTLWLRSRGAYVEANAIVEQSISEIRTVYSSVGEMEAFNMYSSALYPSSKVAHKQGLAKGFGVGALKCILYLTWALIFWIGGLVIVKNGAAASDVIISIFCIIFGGLTLWMATPDIQAFTRGKAACASVWQVLVRTPKLSDDENSISLETIRGRIQLRNVHFAYQNPSGSESVPVFSGLNLDIPQGKSLALVGSSGSGKTTILSLIQRLYDPDQGDVLVDGHDVRTLKLQRLRSQMGMVSQRPAIFAASIKENIRFGRPDASDSEVEAAAVVAHAHSFISNLPLKYETQVGECGAQLSGEQKRRIALARAVLRNPAIFLFDETTGDLDPQSEEELQQTLISLMLDRTSVLVAHRLSTIRNVDKIAVITDGRIVEQGNHDELMSLGSSGVYFTLVNHEKQSNGWENYLPPRKQVLKSGKLSRYSASKTICVTVADASSMHYSISVNSPVGISLSSSASSFVKSCSTDSYHRLGGTTSTMKLKASITRLAKLSLSEWRSILIGTIGAIGSGCLTPITAYTMISAAIELFSAKDIQGLVDDWVVLLALLGCSAIFVSFMETYCFSRAGDKVTTTVRQKLFSGILQNEIGWFDRPENSTSIIATKLGVDATHINALFAEHVTTMIRSVSAVLVAISLAAVTDWRMMLLATAMTPFFVLSGIMLISSMTGLSSELKRSHKLSDKVTREAIRNIKTIASYTAEEVTLMKVSQQLEEPLRKGFTQGLKQGFLYGACQALAQVALAISLLFAGMQLRNGGTTFLKLFRAFYILYSTSGELSQLFEGAPRIFRALQAVTPLFEDADRQTEIHPDSSVSKRLFDLKGSIEMRRVKFSYPSRPGICILHNFNLKVAAGRTKVLVGASGSGKSAVLALLERFYDPQVGHVLIDGKDLKHMNLRWIRQNIALVPRSPAVFNLTIRDNILYGIENATEQEMIQSAKSANAHGFISALPEGYSTLVGIGGAQLSDGQKQRMAIARTILKNAKILLLDEPTRTLDQESARIVQEVLDRYLGSDSRRSVLMVTHCMTRAIQESHDIAVLHDGCILESGNHSSLMEIDGTYAQLVRSQQLRA